MLGPWRLLEPFNYPLQMFRFCEIHSFELFTFLAGKKIERKQNSSLHNDKLAAFKLWDV